MSGPPDGNCSIIFQGLAMGWRPDAFANPETLV
jgi:hypothetical protein